jgi:hypothetical protein
MEEPEDPIPSAALAMPVADLSDWGEVPQRGPGIALGLAAAGAFAVAALTLWSVRPQDSAEAAVPVPKVKMVPASMAVGSTISPQVARMAEQMTPDNVQPISEFDAVRINAARQVDGNFKPAFAFRFTGGLIDRTRAVDCLAAAAYYEAGDDPKGQRAVAQVVLNRVRSPVYPNSVCGVVFQGSDRPTGCQFTFACDGSLLRRTPSPEAWTRAKVVATAALNGQVDKDVGPATHYHANYVLPKWSFSLRKLTTIGAHIFYTWPNVIGLANRPGGAEVPVLALARLAPEHGFDAGMTGANLIPQQMGAVPDRLSGGSAGSLAPPKHMFSQLAQAGVPVGRWAMTAINLCAGQADCQVTLYGSDAEVSQSLAVAPADRDRPLFLFVRDAGSGMELAKWDCDKITRPDPAQCLPSDGAALRRLLRAR